MSLLAELGPELPYLRRYARALTGSQTAGDAAVRSVLAALLAAPDEFDTGLPPRLGLFRLFHRLWAGVADSHAGGGMIANLTLHTRESLLLTAMEQFTLAEAATILGSSLDNVTAEIAAAHQAIADSLQSRVMIIEDEAIIALHIQSIAEDLGHDIVGIARTRNQATAMAMETRPELVLADISLADGSSGIDAVKDILDKIDVPVIFITAFPERLLTGERPEPTWLITKPFSPATVTATIGQALLFHREAASLAEAPAVRVMEDEAPNPRRHFDTPDALLNDPALTAIEKQALLADWDSDMDGRLNAEAEGMGISDPLSARKEGQLADEAARVKTALGEASRKVTAQE
jgi:DNA-directed RNA polymerase specialized sigma24 family protein